MRYFDVTLEAEKEKLNYFLFCLPSRVSRAVPKPVAQATVRVKCVFRWA